MRPSRIRKMPTVKRPKKMAEEFKAPNRPIMAKINQRIVENFNCFPSFARANSRRLGKLKSFWTIPMV